MIEAATKSKGGAPLGNENRLVHGCRSFLVTGQFPKRRRHLKRRINGLGRAVDDAVMLKHGEISLVNAARRQSVLRHEGRAALLTAYFREQEADLSLSDRMALLRDISAATEQRDRVLAALDIETKAGDIWDCLDTPTPSDASDAAVDDSGRVTPAEQIHPATGEYARDAGFQSEGQP